MVTRRRETYRSAHFVCRIGPGHFPSDDAVIKLLWLAIRDIEDKRARARAKEKGIPKDKRKAAGRLVEGATVQGWKQALGALALHYPDRLEPYIR